MSQEDPRLKGENQPLCAFCGALSAEARGRGSQGRPGPMGSPPRPCCPPLQGICLEGKPCPTHPFLPPLLVAGVTSALARALAPAPGERNPVGLVRSGEDLP